VNSVYLSGDTDIRETLNETLLNAKPVPEVPKCRRRRGVRQVPVGGDPVPASAAEAEIGEFDSNLVIEQHDLLQNVGKPNALSMKLPIYTNLNLEFLDSYLHDYEDGSLMRFLKFGFPVNSEWVMDKPVIHKNHSSALEFPEQIDAFINKGLKSHSIIGPFKDSPFENYVISPLATVEKSDSTDRRNIMDLKFSGVNASIPKDVFLGQEYKLRLPKVDAIVDMIRSKGRGCALMKRDLKDAYRQLIRTDYKDIHLFGFKWKGRIYFDLTHPQGCSSAAYCCQCTSCGLKYIYKSLDKDYLMEVYLDDFISAEVWSKAFKADDDLAWVFSSANVVESLSKHCPPDVVMVALGILFNTLDMTVSVTDERMEDIKAILSEWSDKQIASKIETQSLVGKLSFVAACVRPARAFLSRMFASFANFPEYGRIPLSEGFKSDLLWWIRFFPKYNGVSMMGPEEWEHPDVTFASDACLSGCGAVSFANGEYFHRKFPEFLSEKVKKDINCLELLTIVVACKYWSHAWKGKRILVKCDNLDSVNAINNLGVHDKFLQACVRELMLICASGDFQVRAVHIPGIENRLPDWLSRAHLNNNNLDKFIAATDGKLDCVDILDDSFKFEYDW